MATAKKKTGARVQGTKGPESKAGAVGAWAAMSAHTKAEQAARFEAERRLVELVQLNEQLQRERDTAVADADRLALALNAAKLERRTAAENHNRWNKEAQSIARELDAARAELASAKDAHAKERGQLLEALRDSERARLVDCEEEARADLEQVRCLHEVEAERDELRSRNAGLLEAALQRDTADGVHASRACRVVVRLHHDWDGPKLRDGLLVDVRAELGDRSAARSWFYPERGGELLNKGALEAEERWQLLLSTTLRELVEL